MPSTTAFLYPGQGSQEIGMAADLFKDDVYFRELIRVGSDFVKEDLEPLCLKGPDTKLIKAQYLQPLLTAVSLGYTHRLAEKEIVPDYVLGHSSGEITALGATGVVSPEQAVIIAAKRGQIMDSMAQKVDGGMLAALFTRMESVEQTLAALNARERIVIANDNAADQIVLSGDKEMLDRFAHVIREKKLGRCQHIVVSGPWHSPYITEGKKQFEEWVKSIEFQKPHVPIIMNATAKPETDPDKIKKLSINQLTSPVYWRASMETLKQLTVNRLFEIGPGRILSGLARVNGLRGSAKIYNVNNLQGLERAMQDLTSSG